MSKSFKPYLFALIFLLFNFSLSAQPLLTPTELNTIQSDNQSVKVVDIRPTQDYLAGHIVNAVNAPYELWRGPADNPGKLVDVQKLTELVRALGIDQDTLVVVTSSGANPTDFGAAARVYWTLKYLGLEKLAILNGGVQAWLANGLELDKKQPNVVPSQFKAKLNQNILATQEYVATHLDDEKTMLIDARPQDFYLGKTKAPTAKKPGTIKNAINVAHDTWFEPGTSLFVSTEEAKKIAQTQFTKLKEKTISFCNTGHWAATDWFALSEVLEQPNVKLYPASLAEWSHASPALAMDNVPSRGQQILKQLKSLVNK